MKSQQKGNIIDTSCKNCVLAIYDGKTQTGCIENRINKFDSVMEAYDEEKEFYVVNRLCNYYRDSEDYLVNDTPDLDRIKFESQLSFDVIIVCDYVTEEHSKKILEAYNDLSNYDKNKINIHMCFTTLTIEQRKIIDSLRSDIGNPPISYYNNYIFIHNLLMSTTRSYHFLLNYLSESSLNLIPKVNDAVNSDMKKLIAIEDKNVKIISNLAYKVESHKISSNNYNEIINKVISDSKGMNLYLEL